jgi:hypothetical protein
MFDQHGVVAQRILACWRRAGGSGARATRMSSLQTGTCNSPLYLVSRAKQKRDELVPAGEQYCSDWLVQFRKARAYVRGLGLASAGSSCWPSMACWTFRAWWSPTYEKLPEGDFASGHLTGAGVHRLLQAGQTRLVTYSPYPEAEFYQHRLWQC